MNRPFWGVVFGYTAHTIPEGFFVMNYIIYSKNGDKALEIRELGVNVVFSIYEIDDILNAKDIAIGIDSLRELVSHIDFSSDRGLEPKDKTLG